MATILGVFDDPIAARRAMEALRDGPIPLDDVSIISRATESGEPVDSHEHMSAGEGAAVGAVWGGLVGLAALLIPGIGPFIAGGALFAALTGAATGAVIGGIAGALVDSAGVPEAEARQYETMIHEGKTLVAVKAPAEQAAEVRRVLASAGADSLTEDQAGGMRGPVHVAMYENGRRIDTDAEYASAGTMPTPVVDAVPVAGVTPGIYDTPAVTTDTPVGVADPYATREIRRTPDASAGMAQGEGETWTKGEFVGEGQGSGPRTDTGTYNPHQWVGEGQGSPDVTPDRPNTPPPPMPDTNLNDPQNVNPKNI